MASRVTMTTPERRRTPRVEERVPLSLTDGGMDLRTETKNLSVAGAYCALDRFIPPMTKLQLTLELPGTFRRTRVRCTGVVVRVEPAVQDAETMRYHTAVFFSEISDRDRAAIGRFVQRRLAVQHR